MYISLLGGLTIICMAWYVSSPQSKEEKDELITQVKNGHLQIIVGTHALLTERMDYNNLGLLVVDEEQVLFIYRLAFLTLIAYVCHVFI